MKDDQNLGADAAAVDGAGSIEAPERQATYVVPHPSHYVLEEMDERGWDRDRLATEIVKACPHRDWGISRLAIDFFFAVGPTDSACRLGDMAEDLAAAFGTSAELFTNLEKSWLASLASKIGTGNQSSTQPLGSVPSEAP